MSTEFRLQVKVTEREHRKSRAPLTRLPAKTRTGARRAHGWSPGPATTSHARGMRHDFQAAGCTRREWHKVVAIYRRHHVV